VKQRSVGEDCVYVGAACGWVGFDVIVDREEERTSEGSDVRVRCGLFEMTVLSGERGGVGWFLGYVRLSRTGIPALM